MCAPAALGVASFATGALGAVGQHQSASAQASAANTAATRNYKYQLKMRERSWDRERHIYGAKLHEYNQQLDANSIAAQRAYSGEQRKLNEAYKQASFSTQSMLVDLISSKGKRTAESAGRSARRIDNQLLASYGRNQAVLAESLTSARQAGEYRKQGINRELLNANRSAYANVAINPQPGIAPPRPVMQQGPSGLSLLANLGSAAVGGYNTYESLKAPSPYI